MAHFSYAPFVPAVVAALALSAPVAGGDSADSIARGDAAYERRAEGHEELRAAPQPIAEAIAAYQEGLDAAPRNLAARWKLMRALSYQGEYVLESRDSRLAVFARGLDLGEQGLDQLGSEIGGREALDALDPVGVAEALGDQPHAAAIYYWTCIHWGLWSRETGKLEAVRRGVAKKIHDYAEMVIALDETHDRGGAHRILGRLHFEAPRVPLLTGWIDREVARRSLERAAQLAPDDPRSELYLLEAIHRYEPARRSEVIERLRRLASRTPGPERPVEDGRVLADARALLEQWTR